MPENPSNSGNNNLNELLGEARSVGKAVGEEAAKAVGESIRDTMRDAVKEMKSATVGAENVAKALDTTNKSAKQIGREGAPAIREMSKGIEDVNNNARTMENIFGKLESVLNKAKSKIDAIDESHVKLRQTVFDTQNVFGDFGQTIDSTMDRIGRMRSSINEMAQSGRLSIAEVEQAFTSMAQSGVSMEETMSVLGDRNRGGLGLVNSGFMELSDVTQLATAAMNEMGMTADETERQLLRVASGVGQITAEFGQGVISTRQFAQQVLSLQTNMKYLGSDTERLPGMITAFTIAAERFRGATERGMTGRMAAEVAGQMGGAVAGFGLDQRAFFGQMAGMGGGLAAGERFRIQQQRDPNAALANVINVIEELSGGAFMSSAQFEAEERMGRGEAAAQRRAVQAQILQSQLGMGEQQAYGFLDMAGAGQKDEMLRIMNEASKDPIEQVNETLKDNSEAVQHLLQTGNERQQEIVEGIKRLGAEYDAVSRTLHYGSMVTGFGAITAGLLAQTAALIMAFRTSGRGGSGFFDSGSGRGSARGRARGSARGGRMARLGRWGGRAGGAATVALLADQFLLGGRGTDAALGAVGLDNEAGYMGLSAGMMGLYAHGLARGGNVASYSRFANTGKSMIPGLTSAMRYGKGLQMSGAATGRLLPGLGLGLGMWNDWSDIATGGERQYMFAGDNLAGQMAESGGMGVVDALSAFRLGPVGVIANAASKVGRLGVESYRASDAWDDVGEAYRGGTNRSINMGIRTVTREWIDSVSEESRARRRNAEVLLRQHRGALTSAKADQADWWGLGAEDTLYELHRDDTNREEARAIEEIGRGLITAINERDYITAEAYRQALAAVAPDSQKQDDVFRDIERIVGTEMASRADTFDELQSLYREQQDRERADRQAQREEQERQAEEQRRTAETSNVIIQLDGREIARQTVPIAVAEGLVPAGAGLRQARSQVMQQR